MFLADGGGGGASSAPSYAGSTQTLAIDFAAIPAAVKAFQTALDRVDAKLGQLDGLTIRPWAGDTVSSETAQMFEERSYGGGDSALACLRGYRQQLSQAIASLQRAQQGYRNTESDTSATFETGH